MLVRTTSVAVAALLALAGCAEPEQVADSPEPTRAVEEPTSAPAEPEEETSSPEATGSPSASEDPEGEVTAAVYYVGDTERAGPRLFREFRRTSGEAVPATLELLSTAPLDPDYRTAWQPGQLRGVVTGGDLIEVEVDPGVQARPSGMSGAEAKAALQQVVYSLQAATQTRLPVVFVAGDERLGQVLGVPTGKPVGNGSMLQVLNHVSLTSPEQGATSGDRLAVSGVGNSFEANLGWEIRRGDKVVDDGFATMAGWMEDKLFPFELAVDVSGLAPGDYTFWVTTDDPTGGTEGVGAMTDDKDFTVR